MHWRFGGIEHFLSTLVALVSTPLSFHLTWICVADNLSNLPLEHGKSLGKRKDVLVDLVKIDLNYTTHVEGFDVGNIQLCDEKIHIHLFYGQKLRKQRRISCWCACLSMMSC